MRRATSPGERRRVWRALRGGQRTRVSSVPVLMQEADQGRLEIAWVPAHRLLELGRSAGEEQLPVGQEQHPGGVALDLADVVGGEEHGRAQARDELPQPLALARVKRRRWLVEQQQSG